MNLYVSLILLSVYFMLYTHAYKSIINPNSVLGVMFFLPLIMSSLQLSLRQPDYWDYRMQILIAETVFCWAIAPIFFTIIYRNKILKSYHNPSFFCYSKRYVMLVIWFSLIVVFCYLIENVIMTGSPFPFITNMDAALANHAKYVPGLSLLTTTISTASVLVMVQFLKSKNKLYLVVAIFIAIVPITRLGRAEIVMSLIGMLIAYVTVRNNIKLSHVFKGVVLFLLLILLLAYLGDIRTNRFGQFQFSYANYIQYTGVKGPFEVFAVLYGYFCLPFETLNKSIIHMGEYSSYGMLSFRSIFAGLLNLDFLDGFVSLQEYRNHLTPLNVAYVATTLDFFYMDFGIAGAWIPMVFYFGLWFFLYLNRLQSDIFLVLYSYYTAMFAFSAFQAQLAEGSTFREMAVITIAYYIIRKMSFSEKVRL